MTPWKSTPHTASWSAFFSPRTATGRSDAYGGTLEKRTLFPRQIVAAIRRQAGEDFPIIFRFSADDMVEGGNTAADGLEIARIMSRAGVDAFECSAGNQEKGWNTSFNYFFPKNCIAHLARPVGDASGKPVIAVGKINDPLVAEHLLEEGAADFISLGRPFITDPELLIKAKEGRHREIRRCIYCLNCFTYKSRKNRIPTPGITWYGQPRRHARGGISRSRTGCDSQAHHGCGGRACRNGSCSYSRRTRTPCGSV